MTDQHAGMEAAQESVRLSACGIHPGVRALFWHQETLYASRGYSLLRAEAGSGIRAWEPLGRWTPQWWRKLTSRHRLSSRLVRDGFHALTVLPAGVVIAAVPGAIVTLAPGAGEFRCTHRITRGTRPLHITSTPQGVVYWGEYFDNAAREPVRIYGSHDSGATWQIAYEFPRGAIRHVHNIVYDRWQGCLWVLTGDYGEECRMLRASPDFSKVEVVLAGNQQARAVAMVTGREGLYFATDTPLESNFIYRMDRAGTLERLSAISGSSIYGCAVGDAAFFTTMVEPSEANPDSSARIYGARGAQSWQSLAAWQKDRWPMRWFQYGNALLPDGDNRTAYLAITTVAVQGADLTTHIFRVD
jgi:hypothetical protein